MNPDGKDPGTFGYWLRLSVQELQKVDFEITMEADEIAAHTTE